MSKVLYRTFPRLFILGTTFFGSIFFGLLSWLVWANLNGRNSYLALSFLTLFSIFSLGSLYLFITIKRVELSADCVRFSFLFLPIRKTFPFSDIKNISQQSQERSVSRGFSTALRFTYLITEFEFADKSVVKLNSISALDYEELVRCYNKMTRGNGRYVRPKRGLLLYILDNFEGIGIVLLAMIVTVGLAWGILHRLA